MNTFGFRADATRRRCPMQCPSVHMLPPLHPSILPSISSLAGHSHFAKQSSFPFITSSSAAPSFLSVRSSSARPPFLNPSTPIGFFRDLSFERLSSSLYPSSSPPRISSRESSPSSRSSFFFLPFLLSLSYAGTSTNLFSSAHLVWSNALSYFWLPSGKGIRERKAHDDVWKGSCRNIGRNQTFVRFIAHEENRSRSDSVENRSLESPIAILLFTTITSRSYTKKQSTSYPINLSFNNKFNKKNFHCTMWYI